MMVATNLPRRLGLLVLLSLTTTQSHALTSQDTSLTRGRLTEALSSPSGKLTLSPQIVVEDPANPTAILLQASAVQQLSETLRVKAKANCAFVTCAQTSLSSIKTFCNEQEEARGNFPGPLPVVYCQPEASSEDGESDDELDLSALAEAGASGLLVTIPEIISKADDISDGEWKQLCQQALENGLQPIPEVTVSDATAASWGESDMEALVDKLAGVIEQDPVSILFTIQSSAEKSDDENEEEPEPMALPKISRALGRRVPIIGSVSMSAGGGRLGEETQRLKAAGFTGALMRQECLPGYKNSPSLEYVSDFWAACIGDLKSVKSKSFNFQSRNFMDSSAPLEWAKYQKSVLDSGALGEPEDGPPAGLNPDAGDYQGF
ncbi:MAG: hypothetical protein SGILL_000924 [Bacillariaceae sp.]